MDLFTVQGFLPYVSRQDSETWKTERPGPHWPVSNSECHGTSNCARNLSHCEQESLLSETRYFSITFTLILPVSVQDTTRRVGTLIVATIYLQLIQNRYMFRSFTVLQCSHQHCVQPVASDVEVVGYL